MGAGSVDHSGSLPNCHKSFRYNLLKARKQRAGGVYSASAVSILPKVPKRNGRPKILPPTNYQPSEDQAQDPHILRAIGRAWNWRRRMDAGEFCTIQELAEAVELAERHVSRQLPLAYLAPEVLKRLTCGREASAVSLYDLCFVAGDAWGAQIEQSLGDSATGST